jgi:hypothetical protein
METIYTCPFGCPDRVPGPAGCPPVCPECWFTETVLVNMVALTDSPRRCMGTKDDIRPNGHRDGRRATSTSAGGLRPNTPHRHGSDRGRQPHVLRT